MNLSQDCFITDNLNKFIARYPAYFNDENAAMHTMDAIRNLANDMDEFPEDDWHAIKLASGKELDVNFYTSYDENGVAELNGIGIYLVVYGDTAHDTGMDIYIRKLNVVQPAQKPPQKKRQTFVLRYTSIAKITATSEAEAIEELRKLRMANEVGVAENNLDIKCIGVDKAFEFDVKTIFRSKLKVMATSEEEAKQIVDKMALDGRLEENTTDEEFVERIATFNKEITED